MLAQSSQNPFYRKVKRVAAISSALCLRKFFMPLLPNFIQRYIGAKGFTDIITRNGVIYQGRVFGSPFTIESNSKYAVERLGTNRFFSHDPFMGIAEIDITGGTILDIGANVGTYSIGMASLGPKRVFSIEPGPLFSRLQKNIERNNLATTLSAHHVGIANEEGALYWFEDKANIGNAHLLSSREELKTNKIPTQLSDKGVKVPVLPLDKFVTENKIEEISLIKIDVEGMEWEVLKSGSKSIAQFLPIVVAETHRVAPDMMGYDCLTPMFHFFYELGYQSYCWENGRFEKFIYPNFTSDTFFVHDDDKNSKIVR